MLEELCITAECALIIPLMFYNAFKDMKKKCLFLYLKTC